MEDLYTIPHQTLKEKDQRQFPPLAINAHDVLSVTWSCLLILLLNRRLPLNLFGLGFVSFCMRKVKPHAGLVNSLLGCIWLYCSCRFTCKTGPTTQIGWLTLRGCSSFIFPKIQSQAPRKRKRL